MREPTEKQTRILKLIERSIAKRGYPPTLRELCSMTGMRSTNAAWCHIQALVQKGYLERDPITARGLRILSGPGRIPRIAPEGAQRPRNVCPVPVET